MPLTKQAKTLSEKQVSAVLAYLTTTQDAKRNRVIFLLSVDAALRSKEIASVEWNMVLDAKGQLMDKIRLQGRSAKGMSEGIVYISRRLATALTAYALEQRLMGAIIKSRNGNAMSAQVITNWFFNMYRALGFDGCSSHSGRRTAITRWGRNIAAEGGSMRDVQALARHSSLHLTRKYIEVSDGAMKRVVG